MSLTVVCHAEDCPFRFRGDKPMRVIDETHGHVIYECQFDGMGANGHRVRHIRPIPKKVVGGTIGAGRREDQPATQYQGRGF